MQLREEGQEKLTEDGKSQSIGNCKYPSVNSFFCSMGLMVDRCVGGLQSRTNLVEMLLHPSHSAPQSGPAVTVVTTHQPKSKLPNRIYL